MLISNKDKRKEGQDMKAQLVISALLINSTLMTHAFADSGVQRPVTRIDFNKMINDNNIEAADLSKTVISALEKQPVRHDAMAPEKKKVLDFIDVEVGVGVDRPVVDRRFNSVGEARLTPDIGSVPLNPTIKKKVQKGS
jgi:hypothetical protein